jgi:hypothetical protein
MFGEEWNGMEWKGMERNGKEDALLSFIFFG